MSSSLFLSQQAVDLVQIPDLVVDAVTPVSYTHLDVYKRQTFADLDASAASAGYTRAQYIKAVCGPLVNQKEMCIRDSAPVARNAQCTHQALIGDEVRRRDIEEAPRAGRCV